MIAESFIHGFVIAMFVALMAVIAVGDFQHFRIPNKLVVAVVMLYPAHVMSAPQSVPWSYALVFAILIFAIGAGFFAANMMGGGDVKLMAAVSLWAAPQHLIALLLITLAGALVVAGFLALRTAATEARTPDGWSFGLAVANIRHTPILKMSVPYGVGIAAGGVYVAWRLVAG